MWQVGPWSLVCDKCLCRAIFLPFYGWSNWGTLRLSVLTLIPLLFSRFRKPSSASSCLGALHPILARSACGKLRSFTSLPTGLCQSVSRREGTEVCWGSRDGRGTLAFPGPLGLAASSYPSLEASVHEDSISLGWLAGVEGRRTVNLGKLQALRVLNFIRFECVVVKVKSREMTALSKSNRRSGAWKTRANSLWAQMEERDFHTHSGSGVWRMHLFHCPLTREQYALLRAGPCFRVHSGRRKRRTRKKTRLKMSRVACDG